LGSGPAENAASPTITTIGSRVPIQPMALRSSRKVPTMLPVSVLVMVMVAFSAPASRCGRCE